MKDESFYPVERKGDVSFTDLILSKDADYRTARCLLCHCLIEKTMSGYRCANISRCPNNKQHVEDLSRIAYVHEPLKP